MLLDSTAFIDFTRKYPPAIVAFDKLLNNQSTSIITKLELVIGQKTKSKVKEIDSIFEDLKIEVISINEEISKVAAEVLSKYYHSNGIGILDSFIAATAIVHNEELVTRNIKHFDFIPNLKLLSAY